MGVFHNLKKLYNILPMLDRDILLSHIEVFDYKLFMYIFHYFYQIDIEFGFKIFELYKGCRIWVILEYKYLLQNFIDRYGIDYIISLEDGDITKRKNLLEQLPINYAVYMCNKLNLKIDYLELININRRRFKALLNRINVDKK
jgi:hypothetical protein